MALSIAVRSAAACARAAVTDSLSVACRSEALASRVATAAAPAIKGAARFRSPLILAGGILSAGAGMAAIASAAREDKLKREEGTPASEPTYVRYAPGEDPFGTAVHDDIDAGTLTEAEIEILTNFAKSLPATVLSSIATAVLTSSPIGASVIAGVIAAAVSEALVDKVSDVARAGISGTLEGALCSLLANKLFVAGLKCRSTACMLVLQSTIQSCLNGVISTSVAKRTDEAALGTAKRASAAALSTFTTLGLDPLRARGVKNAFVTCGRSAAAAGLGYGIDTAHSALSEYRTSEAAQQLA